MSSTCQNIKTEYDSLKTLKEAFALAWATAKETGDFSSVRQLKIELEKAQDALEEKLWEPWAKPSIRKNWTIDSHKENNIRFIDPSNIELRIEPEQLSDGKITGVELLKHLTDRQGLNACTLDFLLAHKELIPESWKKDEHGKERFVFFAETVYRGSDGGLYICCISWEDSKNDWGWGGQWLVHDFDSDCSVAILAN